MARFLKTTVFAGVPFGLGVGMFVAFLSGDQIAFVFGLAAGALFGLSLATVMAIQSVIFAANDPCREGERILKEGPASYFRGPEGVGGWLYLTDQRLLFRPHLFNFQRRELSIPLKEIIVQAQPSMTLGFIPNGLRVLTHDGVQRFVVSAAKVWAGEINHARIAPALAAFDADGHHEERENRMIDHAARPDDGITWDKRNRTNDQVQE